MGALMSTFEVLRVDEMKDNDKSYVFQFLIRMIEGCGGTRVKEFICSDTSCRRQSDLFLFVFLFTVSLSSFSFSSAMSLLSLLIPCSSFSSPKIFKELLLHRILVFSNTLWNQLSQPSHTCTYLSNLTQRDSRTISFPCTCS